MCDTTQGEPGHMLSHMEKAHWGESKIFLTCPFDVCNYSTKMMNA